MTATTDSTPMPPVPYDLLVTTLFDGVGKHTAEELLGALNIAMEAAAGPTEQDLLWESADTDEPGDQNAESTLRVRTDLEATSAHYSLGPAFAAPSEDGERWSLELIQIRDGDQIAATNLGHHASAQDAKDHAQRWEDGGLVRCAWHTSTEHRARIPLPELLAAAAEDTDPDELITEDGNLFLRAMTGSAFRFTDVLARYEATSDKQHLDCRWTDDED